MLNVHQQPTAEIYSSRSGLHAVFQLTIQVIYAKTLFLSHVAGKTDL